MLSVSLNIILDRLAVYRRKVYVKLPSDRAFSRADLLPRERAGLAADRLYVCRLSDYLRLAPLDDGVCCLCLRDRAEDGTETEALLANTVVIGEEMELTQLFTQVQDIFFTIDGWIREMQDAVIRGRSLQEVLTLSEPVIGNTINISDSALTMLAHTWGIEADDQVTLDLIEHGFHPERTLQKFREAKRFEVWENSTGLILNEHPSYGTYPVVGKVFKFRNTYYAHVAMVCDHHPLTDGLLDLFQLLLDILQFYVQREWDSKAAVGHIYDPLLTELLSGKLKSTVNLEERARYAGVPLTGPYRLLRVDSRQEVMTPLGRMAQELSELLPDGWVLVYQHQLVALMRVDKEGEKEEKNALHHRMHSFLERYDAVCATSMEFMNLRTLPEAYEKACLALKYSGRFYGDELLERYEQDAREKRLFRYDDNLAFYLLGENERSHSIWKDSTYAQALRTLWEYDKQHNTDNLQLLYTYLRCERKATDASQRLHMHRNNVVYRISRIQELLGLDLDDEQVRLCLTLSYLMLRLNGLEE